MKKMAVLGVCFMVFLAAAMPVWGAGDLKMPQANIIKPGPEVSEDISAFSGQWKGRWTSWACPPSHGLDAILIVEEVTNTSVKLWYSWGNDSGWGFSPGCVHITKKAKFERINGKVYLTWVTKNGMPFYFWIEDGKIKGKKGPLTNNPFEVTMERF